MALGTTREEIAKWFDEGVKKSATHMIVVCDTWDYEDYPVYVYKNQNVREVYKEYDGKNMNKIMEVYSLKQNMEKQLSEHRAFHFD